MQITSDYIRECFSCFDDNTLIWKERPVHHFASEKSWEDWCESLSLTPVKLENYPIGLITGITISTIDGFVFLDIREVLSVFGKRPPVLKSNILGKYRSRKAIFDLGNRLSLFGVTQHGNQWQAQLSIAGRVTYIGMFETRREAQRAVFDKIESYYCVKL